MTPLQVLTFKTRQWLDRLRWRLCWSLMPSLGFAQELRRLEKIAQENGASKTMAKGIASAYFNTLQAER